MDVSLLLSAALIDRLICTFFFFFNDTATTEIYTLSLHDALPIFHKKGAVIWRRKIPRSRSRKSVTSRSEEHTSELQSQSNLVCRLLLEKKKKNNITQDSKCTNVDANSIVGQCTANFLKFDLALHM